MSTIARCSRCNESIANIHYESHGPSTLHGYGGSSSFAAVAFPCGHLISAVPSSWEQRLDELDAVTRQLNAKVDYLHKELVEIINLLKGAKERTSTQ